MTFRESLTDEQLAERDEIDKIPLEDSDEWFRRWNRWFRKCLNFQSSNRRAKT